MKLTILGSGSKGNAAVLQKGNKSILIDAGFTYGELTHRMNERGIRKDSIAAVIVTHEHIDHTRGLGVFARIHRIPIYINISTFDNLCGEIKADAIHWVKHYSVNTRISSRQAFIINDIIVNQFPILHDAADPVGYTFTSEGQKISFVTDLGSVTDSVIEHLSNSSIIVLEANHDTTMLRQGKYPDFLKNRIAGPYGHLSNDDTSEILLRVMCNKLQTVYLAHLSQENNRPDLAYQTVRSRLADTFSSIPEIHIAYQDNPAQSELSLHTETTIKETTGCPL